MSKMKALRTAITAKLQESCPRVYYGQAASKMERPYIVYTLEQIDREDDLIALELEANVMDYGQDTGPAEDLADYLEYQGETLVEYEGDQYRVIDTYRGEDNTLELTVEDTP